MKKKKRKLEIEDFEPWFGGDDIETIEELLDHFDVNVKDAYTFTGKWLIVKLGDFTFICEIKAVRK